VDTLTPAEREQLRTADWRDLDRLAFDQRQRVRLEVVENFAGADAGEFTLYTTFAAVGLISPKVRRISWRLTRRSRPALGKRVPARERDCSPSQLKTRKYCTPGKLASVFQVGSADR
jgi:hypothetical protein